MQVEFFEGAVTESQLVDTVEMVVPPRLGEFVNFTALQNHSRYEIISVEHVLETRYADRGFHVEPETSVVSMRCGLMPV